LKNLSTQRWLALLAAGCLAMLAFGIVYLQNHLGLEPCPMCIVQRYALIGVIVWCLLGIGSNAPVRTLAMTWLIAITSAFGAFVAARQSWLQWYPPEVVSCGRDFYGMIENFPLQRAIPMIFKGSGDCTKIDWTFLGGSIANWSFAVFMSIFFLMIFLRLRDGLLRTTPNLESLEPLS
jgi:disulfide bond formation protein DsbB